ncbi:MAG: hypothetical protein N2170_09350 [Bacteroidia bacterium]|nr:hypothetical protein [Bacteroidia bacterium]
MGIGAVWLQLWILHSGTVLPAASVAATGPLSWALRDVDSLFRHYQLQDTIQLRLGESDREVHLRKQPQGYLIEAPDSLTGVYGLYTFLEEKHGFVFVHPLVTLRVLPSSCKDMKIQPRFRWRGFHLHTQHPIELTEAFHDPAFPEGEKLVRSYIDWLVRNRQNYFEFCLLRTVQLEKWVPYFRRIVQYARERGVTVGLDISLRMQQQRAFQLLPRYSLHSKRYLLYTRLQLLASTGIARLNVDLNAAEFVGKTWGPWIDSLLHYGEKIGITVMSRQHVVPPDAYALGDFHPQELPRNLTLCVHSVMCYGLRDSITPVYRCKNFSHLYETLREESRHRKVWYYPETAYWVTFDNSVPIWLLSYLRSRWEDIRLVEGLAEGHLTFSSGWDIGYWLFDWSVARWSWKATCDGEEVVSFPQEGFMRLFGGDTLLWERLIRFQDSVLVGRDLLSYLTPTTPMDEIGWYALPPFQPRLPVPPWKIYRKPGKYQARFSGPLQGMRSAILNWPAWPSLPSPTDETLRILWQELKTAWDITHLRVAFRYHWLSALLSPRGSLKEASHIDSLHLYLAAAEKIVRQLPIRYPHTTQKELCRATSNPRRCRHPHPSYRFGYLYPALHLHFWKRELSQVENGNWSPFHHNIWDIPRILGLW